MARLKLVTGATPEDESATPARSYGKVRGRAVAATEGADYVQSLTKQEYFAARALQGILSGSTLYQHRQDCVDAAVDYANRLCDALSRDQGATRNVSS